MKKIFIAAALVSTLFAAGGEWERPAGMSGSGDSLHWQGTHLSGIAVYKDFFTVNSGKLLHVQVSVRLKKSAPGFRVDPQVRFFDGKEAPLRGLYAFSEGLPRPDEPDIIDYDEYFTIPPKAAKAGLQLLLYGNEGSIELVSCAMTPVEAKPKSEPMRYKYFTNPERLTDTELDAHLKKLPVSSAKVVRCGEYNTIYVNGQEFSSPIFLTTGYNNKSGSLRYNMVRRYYDAGVKIFSAAIALGTARSRQTPSDIWLGPDKYDFAPVRQELRRILREAPDAKILLNLSVSPYRDYGKNFPDELYRADNGQYGAFFHGYMRGTSPEILELAKGKDGVYSPPSNCSVHFKNEAARAIQALCEAVSSFPEGKSVIAVYLNGGVDGQWFDQFNSKVTLTADYSPASVSAFRSYLKNKYENNPEKLRKAWRDPSAAFETAAVPTHEELWRKDSNFHTVFQTSSKCADYCEFLGWNRAQQQIAWCNAVKNGSQNRWLAGSYYSNSGLRGFPQLGLQSVRYLLEEPAVDLFVLIPNYLRNFYEPVHQGGFNGSLVRHGKLMITELDLRNGELPYWGRWGTDFWRSHNTVERFKSDTMRFAASSMEKGGLFHIYDMEGGCFNSDASVEAWKNAAELLKERTPQKNSPNHIGIVASEKFWCYQSFGRGRITAYSVRETPLYALYRAGVKHGVYLPEELLKPDFEAPKVLVFLDAGTLNKQDTDAIRKRYANSGRVLVWMWQPGIFTDSGEENISAGAGFKLNRAPKADYKPLFADGKNADPLMKNIRGFLFPHTPPHQHGWGMAWELADTQATALARYYGTDIAGMAVRRYSDYTEIWCGAPGSLTPQLCRNLAAAAGVPVYLDTDDFCGMGGGMMYISALTAGTKKVTLPENVRVKKVTTGQKIAQKGNIFSVNLKRGEIFVAIIENK